MVLDGLLNTAFGPLLQLPPIWALGTISFLISLFITIVYKLSTDQQMMKSLKEELKTLQKEMRKLSKEPEKMMKVQKKVMEKNMRYMTSSFKPMLITMIPIIIIFGWLGSHMAYYPLVHNKPFTVTAEFGEGLTGNAILQVPDDVSVKIANAEIVDGKAMWQVQAPANEIPYSFVVEYEGNLYDKDVLVTPSTTDRRYEEPVRTFKNEPINSISLSNEKIKPLNLFGWELGWLGTYIVFSIIFSMVLRKLMKVY